MEPGEGFEPPNAVYETAVLPCIQIQSGNPGVDFGSLLLYKPGPTCTTKTYGGGGLIRTV